MKHVKVNLWSIYNRKEKGRVIGMSCFIILNRPIIIQTFSSAHHCPMVIVGSEILQIPDENTLLYVVINC